MEAILSVLLLAATVLIAASIVVLVRTYEWWSVWFVFPFGLTGVALLGMVFNLWRQRSWR